MDTKAIGKYNTFEGMRQDLRAIYIQLESEYRTKEIYTPYQQGQLITLGQLVDKIITYLDYFIHPLDKIK